MSNAKLPLIIIETRYSSSGNTYVARFRDDLKTKATSTEGPERAGNMLLLKRGGPGWRVERDDSLTREFRGNTWFGWKVEKA